MRNIDDLIEEFNEGDSENILKYFGNFETFFKVVERRGKIGEIQLSTGASDDYENELLLHFYRLDKEKFYYWCNKFLEDVEFDNGKIYCIRSAAGDFAELFCDGRNTNRSFIEEVLDGNVEFDWWFDDDVNVYRYVIEELTPENLQYLKQRFINELSGINVSPETNVLEEIAEKQGHSDYVIVDSSNIDVILNDERTTNYLLDNEMDSDIKNDSSRVYNYSNNASLENEYYEEVWSELTSDYFEGKPEWVTRKHGWKKDVNVEMVRLEITDFDGIILDYLDANKHYGSSGNLSYHGTFLAILKDAVECLSCSFPDYASYPEKYINDYFKDYF